MEQDSQVHSIPPAVSPFVQQDPARLLYRLGQLEGELRIAQEANKKFAQTEIEWNELMRSVDSQRRESNAYIEKLQRDVRQWRGVFTLMGFGVLVVAVLNATNAFG